MGKVPAMIGVVLCLATAGVPAAAKKKKSNPAALALFKKALAVSDIEAKGSPAFRLQAKVTIFGSGGQQTDGMLVKFWTPGNKWREETMLQGYSLVNVSDGQREWEKSALSYVPFPIFQVWTALGFPRRLREQLGQLAKVRSSWLGVVVPRKRVPAAEQEGYLGKPKREDGNRDCVKVKGRRFAPEFCFDIASGDLVREVDRETGLTYEYSDYTAFAQEDFPRTVRISYATKNKLLEIHVTRIDPLTKPAPSLFLRPGGSQEELSRACGKLNKGKMVKTALPVYPSVLKANGVQGRVVSYAYIGVDGTPRGMWPLVSPSPLLTESMLKAAGQWRYKPVVCKIGGVGHPVPVATYITVIFKLAQ